MLKTVTCWTLRWGRFNDLETSRLTLSCEKKSSRRVYAPFNSANISSQAATHGFNVLLFNTVNILVQITVLWQYETDVSGTVCTSIGSTLKVTHAEAVTSVLTFEVKRFLRSEHHRLKPQEMLNFIEAVWYLHLTKPLSQRQQGVRRRTRCHIVFVCLLKGWGAGGRGGGVYFMPEQKMMEFFLLESFWLCSPSCSQHWPSIRQRNTFDWCGNDNNKVKL